ncbi:MAG TPA: hypothetical protein VHC69_06165 [Polyangiaceae bacterium]|nr:hypothetical protein [Polyangiaceae bacterium]
MPDVVTIASMCAAPPVGALPSDVFCTGLYAEHDASKHASDVQPYTPGVTLWSDGAEKQRYLFLPKGTQIDTSDMDSWKFPVGTKAWKEFRFSGKLVETRLFWKIDAMNWASGTYIWNEANSTATLDTSTKPILLTTGYEIPTAKDCDKCHHGGADKLLGLEAVALSLPTAVGVTLGDLAKGNSLSNRPVQTSATLPEDTTGKAGAALGYLHANCGMPCHSARGLGDETKLVLRIRASELLPVAGSAPTGTDARATDAYKATVGMPPTTASVAQQFPGDDRVTPGHHEQSLVWQLPHRRDKYQMPPLVSHVVDDVGTQKIADWIDALTP